MAKRAKEKKKSGKLSLERINLLAEIGVVWDAYENSWHDSFDELKSIKESGGNVNGPFKSDGYSKLNVWLILQKQNHKNGTLSKERTEKLSSLGIKWLK